MMILLRMIFTRLCFVVATLLTMACVTRGQYATLLLWLVVSGGCLAIEIYDGVDLTQRRNDRRRP